MAANVVKRLSPDGINHFPHVWLWQPPVHVLRQTTVHDNACILLEVLDQLLKVGDEVEAVVLTLDRDERKMSLGIKQLDKDPFSGWLAEHPKNSVVKGVVTEVDARGAVVDLGDGVTGSLRASELARGRVDDARTVLKVGDEIEAKFTNVDRKNRSVALSVKAKEVHEEAEALSTYKSDSGTTPTGTTLGELLKEKMTGGADQ